MIVHHSTIVWSGLLWRWQIPALRDKSSPIQVNKGPHRFMMDMPTLSRRERQRLLLNLLFFPTSSTQSQHQPLPSDPRTSRSTEYTKISYTIASYRRSSIAFQVSPLESESVHRVCKLLRAAAFSLITFAVPILLLQPIHKRL